MKKILSLLIIVFCFANIAVAKHKLRVLFVGGSPDFYDSNNQHSAEEVRQSALQRTADFAKFLSKYFTTVKAIQGKDYVASMSDKYDVTIFDGTPKPLKERVLEMDEHGRTTKYEVAKYLPYDFDRACVCIAEMSDRLGRSVGTKNDWFCLCLDADAHHWNAEHPIFQGPFKVTIKPVMKPTPAHAYEYAPMYGQVLEDEYPMFPIQKVGYETKRDCRIGMVSRPWGYTDSPDAEYISSGVCAKSIDAVAIGRHANFFHWGFAASPKDMTEEGKILFLNSVAYMAQFNGKKPIARKLDDRMDDRATWKGRAYFISEEGYNDYVKSEKAYNAQMKQISDSIKAVKAAGGEVDPMYQSFLNWKEVPITPRDTYSRQQGRELYPYFGDNAELYKQYYAYNEPYMYYDYKSRQPKIDIEARELGIANNDIRILDKCISMLEQNIDAKKAQNILERYTLVRFGGAKEWREWFETYKDLMFFSEGGGFVWLINTYDTTVPGNDYSIRTLAENTKEQAPAVSETDDRNPVALSASVSTTADGQKEIIIRMKLHQGYHTYLSVSEKDPFIPTEIKIEVPQNITKVGSIILPPFRTMATGTTIFEGDCIFHQKITGNAKGKATISVSYQCCNNDVCLQPATKTMEVEL